MTMRAVRAGRASLLAGKASLARPACWSLVGLLACAVALAGCSPSVHLHEAPHIRCWDTCQAQAVLRASLEYAGMKHIEVGQHAFSYVEPLPGPVVDTTQRVDVDFNDVDWVELRVTQLDYLVVVHQLSRGGAAAAELPFATHRTARNCADALATLSHR